MSTVDVVVRWAGTPIAVERLEPGQAFTFGSGEPAARHFVCDHPAIPSPRFPLVEHVGPTVRVRAPAGTRLFVDGRALDATEVAVPERGRARVVVGPLTVDVGRDRRAPTAIMRLKDVVDARLLRVSGTALVLHLGLIGLLLLARAPARDDRALPAAARILAPIAAPRRVHVVARSVPARHLEARVEARAAPSARARAVHHRALDAHAIARAALAGLHLDGGATSSVFGTAGPRLDDVRGASFAVDDAGGVGVRDIGAGAGDGVGVPVGSLFGERHGVEGSRDVDLGAGGHRGVVVRHDLVIADGGLDRDEIQRVLRRVMPQIKYCYERQLNGDPGLEGKLAMSWTIARDGAVAATRRAASTLAGGRGDAVGACVTRVIARLRFPAPRGGGEVVVTYPFVFTSSGG